MALAGLPMSSATLRMAAKSHNKGTPVKSCKTTRATINGISSLRAALGCQLASCFTCSKLMRLSSALRMSDSKMMRIEIGRRDTESKPKFFRAGKEQYLSVLPLLKVKACCSCLGSKVGVCIALSSF